MLKQIIFITLATAAAAVGVMLLQSKKGEPNPLALSDAKEVLGLATAVITRTGQRVVTEADSYYKGHQTADPWFLEQRAADIKIGAERAAEKVRRAADRAAALARIAAEKITILTPGVVPFSEHLEIAVKQGTVETEDFTRRAIELANLRADNNADTHLYYMSQTEGTLSAMFQRFGALQAERGYSVSDASKTVIKDFGSKVSEGMISAFRAATRGD